MFSQSHSRDSSVHPDPTHDPFGSVLDRQTRVGSLWRTEGGRLRCLACGHRCLISPGKRGVCKVRFSSEGQLRVPFGYVAGAACDPVEKKPFYHVYPGSDALTFGMLGCDFHCAYCQNWVTSQVLRDDAASAGVIPTTAQQLVQAALRHNARLVVSSYNEPLITAEWAVQVFREAKAAGLSCAFVSNGNATPEVLDFLQPWIVACKIDLKSFNDRQYRQLGGTLENVKNGIRMVHERGIWLEVVTLLVPGLNDSEAEVREMARFLRSVSADIPWHITAFHPDYKLTDAPATGARQLMRAAEIGTGEGLRYVYVGNMPGRAGAFENTHCHSCGETLIERVGFSVQRYALKPGGVCGKCDARIPGLWSAQDGPLSLAMGLGSKRYPRPVRLT